MQNKFEVQSKCSSTKARTGVLSLARGEVKTPVFMPCGTKGMVKTMLPNELEQLGVNIMLGNTYHLFLRPGDKLVAEAGGLPAWNQWHKPMLTDSGGFQVFSLQGSRTNSGKSLVKITDNGVEFRSYLDGAKHFLTPEEVMRIQFNLGADIIMAFDECVDAKKPIEYQKEALKRTHNWWIRCLEEFNRLQADKPANKPEQSLFPIVQGGTDLNLRTASAKFMDQYQTVGIAFGGLAVGETKDTMYKVLDHTVPLVNEQKARYLMGVGSPDDLVEGVARGIDMFDCVLPTRLARHGAFWLYEGRQIISNEKFKNDHSPLNDFCPISGKFSKSFVRHLFIENEITALRILTIHNLAFLMKLMSEMRSAIQAGSFKSFYDEFRRRNAKY